MDLLEWLIHGTIPVAGGQLSAPEVVGNLFGLASAVLGMRRLVWAWPIGLVGNVLLFVVFASGELSGVVAEPLWGQAGRQVFFAAVSRLRLGALVAVAARRGCRRRRGDHAALGHREPSARQLLGARRRRLRRRLRGPPADRLVGSRHRGLDPRRLDARDLRHGPRLGGVLARVDARRRRRRDHPRPGRLLPDGRDVPRLRRVRRGRVRRVDAGQCPQRDHEHAQPTPSTRRWPHERPTGLRRAGRSRTSPPAGA